MSPIITEIMHVHVNDAFTAQPELYKELRNGARKGGLVHQHYGLGIEDPKQLYWILHFDQGFLPKDFTWPAEYGDFPQKIGAISTAEPVSYFMPLDEFPSSITAAPATLTLKSDVDLEKYKQTQNTVLASLRAAPGNHGACFSVTETDPSRAYVFVGWDAIGDQHKWMEKESALLRGLYEHLQGSEIVHVKFTAHA
ncbi:hypothetical protein WOLCODRAFT_81646 [Wolfiporia cocos MD-104 SS10]|uniref:ABM domain-containing protein n=1 Tax=Wolfiporia cocos (strain MD-104) TaxID=742152 RepID=A0A2H3J0Q8_WOLCO|nr:hypothetical protein WOLCODRAFT_81646 [Wolfiporia cocos MD-104 SS10]